MTGAVLFSLVPAEPTFEIGEPIWLGIRVENHGTELVHGTIESGLTERTQQLFVTVTDAEGQTLPDAWRFPGTGWANSKRTTVSVPAGDQGELRIDLAKYAWIDAPGTYDVRLLAPIGVQWNDPKPASQDPRWVETRVTLVPAVDRAALVASIPMNLNVGMYVEGRSLPWMDVNTYDALAHEPFVGILEPLAAASRETESQRRQREKEWSADPTDERALYGLGGCPCTKATEALIRLYDRLDTPPLRRMVERELLYRVPRPEQPPSWFVEHSWDPRFIRTVLALGRAALQPSSRVDWMNVYGWGAEIVRRLGDASDVVLITQALERVRAAEPMLHGRRTLTDDLEAALEQVSLRPPPEK